MSRVHTLPAVDLTLDGTAMDGQAIRALSEVRVRQALSLPAQCELIFRDPPGPLSRVADVRPGARLEVGVRGQGGLFQGEVTAVEHAFEADGEREIRVRAYDLSHRLRRRQTVRAHVGVSPAGLAGELAREVGLTIDTAADGPRHAWLVQHHRSDLDMLVDALERCGLFYTVRGGCMHVLTLEGLGETVSLALGSTLLEARLEMNADAACREVAVAGWDPVSTQAHLGRAGRPRTSRAPAAWVPDGTRSVANQAVSGQAHADAIAQAELDVRATGEVRFSGVAEGDVRLGPGARVTVSGAGAALTGSHVLTDVTHTLDDRRGYVTELGTEPPRPATRPAGAAMTEAVVTQVHDPDGRGRVKVRLPGYFDVETDWMPVVTLGAGSGKGLLVQPDVDDTVLVLMAHGDPAEGVVLGGLYGQREVPDSAGVVGGSVRQYQLRTPGGQVVSLDDEGGSIMVRDRDGSFVHLSPHKVTLRAKADLDIDASGHRVVIRGRAIDFESA